MTLPLPPYGRVAETRFRDVMREIVRSTQPQPARPTKTIVPPEPAPAGLRAAADGPPPETMPLIGGWSLSTDTAGALWLTHTDGSRQLLAARTTPAPPESTSPTTTEPTEGDDQHG